MKKKFTMSPDTPLRHEDHPRPVTRREFVKQGFLTGSATVLSGGVFSLFANPNAAMAAVAPDLRLVEVVAPTPRRAIPSFVIRQSSFVIP